MGGGFHGLEFPKPQNPTNEFGRMAIAAYGRPTSQTRNSQQTPIIFFFPRFGEAWPGAVSDQDLSKSGSNCHFVQTATFRSFDYLILDRTTQEGERIFCGAAAVLSTIVLPFNERAGTSCYLGS